jgi:hypothetical protein
MRDILERLAELRDRDRELTVFGARAHKYQTHPALPATIVAFERAHGARLPDAFRAFLLEVTDGGAGPGYGLFSLERSPGDDVAEDLALLAQPFESEVYFSLEAPDPDAAEDEDAHEAAMSEYWREMPGTMTLCHYGCALRAQLVVTGPLAGMVVFDARADMAGVRPFGSKQREWNGWKVPLADDPTSLDLLAWYRDWIDASLATLAMPR